MISFHYRDNGYTHICGHRGFSSRYPENTIPAFDAARAAGATACEIDLVLTRDGEPIVLHDMTLDRTTTGSGYAGDLNLIDIKALDAGRKMDSRFAGTQVPTFREALEWAKSNGIGLDVELKDEDRPRLLAKRVVEILLEAGGLDFARVISFDHKALSEIKVLDSRVRTQAIVHARHADILQVLKSCGAESASIELMMFDEEDALAMHAAGFCNRIHLPQPAELAIGQAHGRDIAPKLRKWIRAGLIDCISGDDVTFLRSLVSNSTSDGEIEASVRA